MQSNKLSDLEQTLLNELNHFEQDAKAVFISVSNSFELKLTFTLRLFTFIDHYSSYLAGWSDSRRKSKDDKRSQTKRMVDFLEHYLGYGREESYVAINFWRHLLVHTTTPRIFRKNGKLYTWHWNYDCSKDLHWKFEQVDYQENTFRLLFGFYNLIGDLRVGIKRYCDELTKSKVLQRSYESYLGEII